MSGGACTHCTHHEVHWQHHQQAPEGYVAEQSHPCAEADKLTHHVTLTAADTGRHTFHIMVHVSELSMWQQQQQQLQAQFRKFWYTFPGSKIECAAAARPASYQDSAA